jgi:hypothetical protein
VDFAAEQHDIIMKRHEGTGQWFLDAPEFQNWMHGGDKTLFCPGIPGAGKTMMAAIAVDHVSALCDKMGLAYIFCRYKAQADQNVSSLLASLLKQLVQNRPQTAAATTLIERHFKRRSRPSLNEMFEALQSVCADYPVVHIVVDALDECDDRRGDRSALVDKLYNLQAGANVRLLFTSRFIPEIEQKFRSKPWLKVHANNEDVHQFVAGQVQRLSNCIQRNDELKREAQDTIVKAVDGMYVLYILLAALAVR